MLNVLSVDVEDYFQVEAFSKQIAYSDWGSHSFRVEQNTDTVLELFAENNVRGTFFILGWVAERLPHIIQRIAMAGHEIACHGFAHQHIRKQTPEQFRMDIRKARQQLENEAGQAVHAYRAPSFSIVRETLWALDVLAEEGFLVDSSIFPASHDIYGIKDAPRFPHWKKTTKGNMLFEFPPSTMRLFNRNSGVGGGGYLRILPYSYTRKILRHINESEHQPAMVYFHPWEFDPGQPRISAGMRSRLRHYTNLSAMKKKVEHLLQDFRFGTLTEVCRELEAYRAGPENTGTVMAD
jgi:polysaccharide deacetylase family protein (PEP-CTERM system associated)